MTERDSSLLTLRTDGKPKIKLCRVDTVQGAYLAWEAGIDLIGLHVLYRLSADKSERFKRIIDLVDSFRADRAGPDRGPCVPVLVTHSTKPGAIAEWCHKLNFPYVQLHNQSVTRKIVLALRSGFRRLARREIGIIKTVVVQKGSDIRECRRWVGLVEALLFDSKGPGGTGKKANWSLVRKGRDSVPELPTFIAGGIKPEEARLAIETTHADAVDVQTFCEVPKRQREPKGKKIKRKKRKHINQVLALCATVRAETKEAVRRRYLMHRADFRLLLSIADLRVREARRAIRLSETLMIDGLQVDGSDGSFVPGWRSGPIRWAQVAWTLAPEVPIWLHLFSKDWIFIHQVARSVEQVNPHLVGIFLQCPPDVHPSTWFSEAAREQHRLPRLLLAPSFAASQVNRLKSEELASSLSMTAAKLTALILVTAPDEQHDPAWRAERTTQALRILREATSNRQGNWRIGVDRGISLSLLADMKAQQPDFVVAGRSLVRGGLERNLNKYRHALTG